MTESSDSTTWGGSATTRGRGDTRVATGRREVVAMACQPCRKRKTKCDGQRPICSACVQRGHTNCFYDSSSDMRRTSALKKRIDHLLDDITSLRNIILTLTRGYNIPQDPMVVQMIEQTLCHGRWSYLPELSRVLEQHTATVRQAVQTPQEREDQALLSVSVSSFQPQHLRSMTYGGGVAPPSWSPIDMRTTPAFYTDVGQSNPSYLGSCAYRPLPQY